MKCKIPWLTFVLSFEFQTLLISLNRKICTVGVLRLVWLLRRRGRPWESQSSGRQWRVAALINHPCLKSDLCPNHGINIRGALLWFLLWIWPRSIASKRKLCWIITNFICADLLEIRQDRWVVASAHLITPFPDFFSPGFILDLFATVL